jgi:hypothetical protein
VCVLAGLQERTTTWWDWLRGEGVVEKLLKETMCFE